MSCCNIASKVINIFDVAGENYPATLAEPSMLLVWLWLGSPKDPRGSVGLFLFFGSKLAVNALALSRGGLICVFSVRNNVLRRERVGAN
jgi:hypothetical protein